MPSIANDIYWLKHARLAATKYCCATSRKVGAVIVSTDNRLLCMGYNGVPSKVIHPTICMRTKLGLKTGEQPHLCGCIHAEANALINAARHGACVKGATIYCTTQPCITCLGMIINSGMKRIVAAESYTQDGELFARFLRESRVVFDLIEGESGG